jgi:hypothetical protein
MYRSLAAISSELDNSRATNFLGGITPSCNGVAISNAKSILEPGKK